MADATPRLTITCLGPPTVRIAGADPPPAVMWRKNFALLVYLALSPGRTRSREHLIGLLWPEKDESRARHSLNEAIRRLRGALGTERIQSQGDAVILHDTGLEIDLGIGSGRLDDAQFLDGLTLADAPAFEDWLAAERMAHRDRRMEGLLRDGEHILTGSRYGEAQTIGRTVLTMDAYSEPAVRLLMRAAALAGDAAGGLRAYHEFQNHLKNDLGEQPSRELAALAARLRDTRWRRVSVGQEELETPLVGRDATCTEAFSTLRKARSLGPRTILVEGAGGSGKTRLLTECANRWMLDGGVVVSARPLEGDRGTDWSALRQLMRGGLKDAPGLTGTAPEALAALAGVVPELSATFEPHDVVDRGHIATALVDLLRAVAEEMPLVLSLDDAEAADDATVQVLSAAMGTIADLPVVLILSTVDLAVADRPELTRLHAEIGRRLKGTALRLAPLDTAATLQLVREAASWCTGADQQDRLARRLVFETGGNVLLTVTLLRGLRQHVDLRDDATVWPPPQETFQAPVPTGVPPLVRAVTVARVAQLSDTARTVLITASVRSRDIDPDLLSRVSRLSPDDVEAGLAELERHEFVAFDGERHLLRAPLVSQVVKAEFLTPGQRHRLEQRVLDSPP